MNLPRSRELLARLGLVLAALVAVYLLASSQVNLHNSRAQIDAQDRQLRTMADQLRDAERGRLELAAQLAAVTAELEAARAELAGRLGSIARGVDRLPSRIPSPRPTDAEPSPGAGGSPGPAGPPGPPGPTGPAGTSPDRSAPSVPPVCVLPRAVPVLCP